MRTQVVAGRWPSLAFAHDVGGGVIQPPVAPPSGDFPNQPVGWTVQLDTPFSLLAVGQNFGVPVSTTTNNSGMRLVDLPDQNRLSIVDGSTGVRTDSTGGTVSGTVIGTTGMMSSPWGFSGVFPVGATKGSAPWSLMPAILTGFNKIYIAQNIMLSSNFRAQGITGFKHFWPELDTAGGQEKNGTTIYTSWDDSDSSGAGLHLHYELRQQGTVDRGMQANQGAGSVTLADFSNRLGQWTTLEMILERNTNNSTADGRGRVWITGTLTHDYTDINWQGTASPRKWNHVQWEPTWGGDIGGPYPAADMYMYVDRMVIAGSDT